MSDSLESALESLTQSVSNWDPDFGEDVTPILEALKALHLRFDPRKDRLSASLCVTSMKLLEQIHEHGNVGREAAVGAVGELAQGLRETLATEAAVQVRSSARKPFKTLKSTGTGTSLSLKLDAVDNRPISEVMVTMGVLTNEQVDKIRAVQAEGTTMKFGEIAVDLGFCNKQNVESALRLQQRGRGEVPPPQQGGGDPWGNSPL